MGLANRNTEITILTVSYIQESRGKQEHNLARKGRYKEDQAEFLVINKHHI